jgi:hypothetical protein
MQLFRTPHLKLLLNDVIGSGEQPASREQHKDYTLEQEQGTLYMSILPPNMRDINEGQFGNLFARGGLHDPAGFVLIGRPDFTETTYAKARQFSAAYGKSILLYPAYEICERYVLALEGEKHFSFA